MTFLEFKSFVFAGLQRSETSLTVDGVKLLDRAVNMARKNIERKRDFEFAKNVADLTLTVGSAADLSGAKYAGTATAIDIKTVLNASLSLNGSTFFPINFLSRKLHFAKLRRAHDGLALAEEHLASQPTHVSSYGLVQYGETVYLSPSDQTSYGGNSTVTARMDVVRWLDDYEDDDDTDFLLEHCVDYLMLETFRYLQIFIRDDARLAVSDDALAIAWQALVAWDSNLVVGDTDDANLD